MADIFDKESRSYIMSQIRGKNTKPEILVRKFLHAQGFRFRLHDKRLPGTPDIVLPKYKTVIFVHGCFWHGHKNCKKATLPASNIEFWETKITANISRDAKAHKDLKKLGWHIIVVWECKLNNKTTFDKTMNKLVESISQAIIEIIPTNNPPFQPIRQNRYNFSNALLNGTNRKYYPTTTN